VLFVDKSDAGLPFDAAQGKKTGGTDGKGIQEGVLSA
jgi:hypothetical protein